MYNGNVNLPALTTTGQASHSRNVRERLQLTLLLTNWASLDTAGTEQFTAMRELYMKQGQGFLLVFAITNMNSFQELAELREQIIRIKDDENVPMVVVGNKADLEDDRAVPRARAFQQCQQWGNAPYFESSARRRANVDEAFINLCRQIMIRDTRRDQLHEQQIAVGRRERPNRHDRRGRRQRNRDRCVIL
jgi:Ras-related protein Rap-1B